jgi:HAD hydrolase, family IA, variant 3
MVCFIQLLALKQNSMDIVANCHKAGFLFDLDGVLIDSEREYSKIWAQVNNEYPTGVKSLESVIKGCTLDKILDDHYPDMEVRKKVVKRLYELEGKMKYRYLPGAHELLSQLRQRGIPAALVTSSNDVKMAHLDEELPDIRSYFNFIVTADLISKSKPDPEGYLLGASSIGCEIGKCVVFEDSLQGVKAGHNARAYVIGVAGTLPREVLEPYCDIVVDSLEEIELESLLKTLENRKTNVE